MAQVPVQRRHGLPRECELSLDTKPSCGAAVASPQVRYSYYNHSSDHRIPTSNPPTQQRNTLPLAFQRHRTPKGPQRLDTAMPQATRCWSIYPTTAQINAQWQAALTAVKTPFQNYMLIGTQWGARGGTARR